MVWCAAVDRHGWGDGVVGDREGEVDRLQPERVPLGHSAYLPSSQTAWTVYGEANPEITFTAPPLSVITALPPGGTQ